MPHFFLRRASCWHVECSKRARVQGMTKREAQSVSLPSMLGFEAETFFNYATIFQ